jgi:signal transduction histidine kinase
MTLFFLGLILGSALSGVAAIFICKKRQRKISKFLAFVGHEINTPATALRLTTLNFLEGIFGELPVKQKLWLEIINEQTGRLAFLVGELRDFVHMELGDDMSIHMRLSSVREIVDEGRLSICRGLEQSNISLEDVVPENLPQVFIDHDRTVRVLSSLLFYARKFHQTGQFRLDAIPDERWVDLNFRFTPHPMTQEELERSLDLLYPAALLHSSIMKSAGFGLGFARHLMRVQGGDMFGTLNSGGELTLVLRLPREEA